MLLALKNSPKYVKPGEASFLPVLLIHKGFPLAGVLLGTSACNARRKCILGLYLTLSSAVLGLYRAETGHGGHGLKTF